jgi:2-hydroxycyclohexanecarboxyl-CoA dehydrogenase
MPEAVRALLTGAAGGIGTATAAALEAQGCEVIGVDLPRSGGDVSAADVSDAAAVERLILEAEREGGPIDVLVNCAGIDVEIDFVDISHSDWRTMLGVHLGGTFNTCRVLGPLMYKRRRGSIVNVSSELALAGSTNEAHYATAKGAIIGFTKALALELAPHVRVNSVAPGPTDTAMLKGPWRSEEYYATLPTRHVSTPEGIGATIAFVASEKAGFLTGQIVSPNSGTVI